MASSPDAEPSIGQGLMALSPAKRAPIENGLNTLSTALFEFIHIIMRLARIGAAFAMGFAIVKMEERHADALYSQYLAKDGKRVK